MVIMHGQELQIVFKNCEPEEQRSDIIKALGVVVQWYSYIDERTDADDRHLHLIGQLIEQLGVTE